MASDASCSESRPAWVSVIWPERKSFTRLDASIALAFASSAAAMGGVSGSSLSSELAASPSPYGRSTGSGIAFRTCVGGMIGRDGAMGGALRAGKAGTRTGRALGIGPAKSTEVATRPTAPLNRQSETVEKRLEFRSGTVLLPAASHHRKATDSLASSLRSTLSYHESRAPSGGYYGGSATKTNIEENNHALSIRGAGGPD